MSRLCFDTTALLLFAKAGKLDWLGSLLGEAFVPEYIRDAEIGAHVARYPENQKILDAPWLHAVPSNPDDARYVAQLVERWGSIPPNDLGEAEMLAACKRFGYTGVCEDEIGRKAASTEGVTIAYSVSILIAATVFRVEKPSAAWTIHCSIEKHRKSHHILSPTATHKPVFMTACRAAWSLQKRLGATDLPGYPRRPQWTTS